MSYVDDLAEALRRTIPAHLIPDADTAVLFRIYAVLALAKGQAVELEDVHDAWAAWMSGVDPSHPSLEPLGGLSAEVRHADQPYLEAIRALAKTRGLGR